MTTPTKKIPALVRRLYRIVGQLEAEFPGRKFTPDGHLVGSIGEVIAADRYGLELLTASAEKHDAQARNGTYVQIKATQREQVGLRANPEHLIVLKLDANGEAEEVYNGPGARPWKLAGKMQKNGQRSISLGRLRKLQDAVPKAERIAARR